MYFSIIALRDILPGDVLECWRHSVLACRTLCTQTLNWVMHYYYNFVVVIWKKIVLHQTCILAVSFMSALLTMVRCMCFADTMEYYERCQITTGTLNLN